MTGAQIAVIRQALEDAEYEVSLVVEGLRDDPEEIEAVTAKLQIIHAAQVLAGEMKPS